MAIKYAVFRNLIAILSVIYNVLKLGIKLKTIQVPSHNPIEYINAPTLCALKYDFLCFVGPTRTCMCRCGWTTWREHPTILPSPWRWSCTATMHEELRDGLLNLRIVSNFELIKFPWYEKQRATSRAAYRTNRCVYMLLGHISVEKKGGRHVTLEICPNSI